MVNEILQAIDRASIYRDAVPFQVRVPAPGGEVSTRPVKHGVMVLLDEKWAYSVCLFQFVEQAYLGMDPGEVVHAFKVGEGLPAIERVVHERVLDPYVGVVMDGVRHLVAELEEVARACGSTQQEVHEVYCQVLPYKDGFDKLVVPASGLDVIRKAGKVYEPALAAWMAEHGRGEPTHIHAFLDHPAHVTWSWKDDVAETYLTLWGPEVTEPAFTLAFGPNRPSMDGDLSILDRLEKGETVTCTGPSWQGGLKRTTRSFHRKEGPGLLTLEVTK
ncbi:MAG: hypothetical protein D6819_06575 [Gammaproteobacteria bacterium]|nr:MAG: hypothetical protein D6819_06575 [Gammaproteobacteria bacterium]